MSGSDDPDPERARKLAWRFAKPGEVVDLTEEPDEVEKGPAAEPTAEEKAKHEAWRAKGFADCEKLAASVERAWEIADPALQRTVTDRKSVV